MRFVCGNTPDHIDDVFGGDIFVRGGKWASGMDGWGGIWKTAA